MLIGRILGVLEMKYLLLMSSLFFGQGYYTAGEGEMCGGFQQVQCKRGLTCLFFEPARIMDRQGVCVYSFILR